MVLIEIPPFTLALVRFLLASALLLPTIHLNPTWRISWTSLNWSRPALMGFTGVTLYFVTENLGLMYTSASDAALIMAGIPALTAALSSIFLKERLTTIRAAGISVSTVGIALVVTLHDTTNTHSLLGNLLVCLSALLWAIYTILAKSLYGRLPDLVITALTIAFGTLFLIPFAGYELAHGLPEVVSLRSWLIVAYLSLAASTAAYALWNYALSRLDASVTSNFLNLTPLVMLAMAGAILAEPISTLQLAGAALVLSGVYLTSRPSPASPPAL